MCFYETLIHNQTDGDNRQSQSQFLDHFKKVKKVPPRQKKRNISANKMNNTKTRHELKTRLQTNLQTQRE